METRVILVDNNLALRLKSHTLEVSRELKDAVEDIARVAASLGAKNAPAQTGNLKRNITSTRARKTPQGYEAVAGVRRLAPYGVYVESGTGIFGPSGTRIKPVTGNFLAFRVGNRTVYARSVKGQPAKRFMRRAYIETQETYIRPRLAQLERAVGNFG